MGAEANGRSQGRVEWIDLTKAVCILLVVFLHVQNYARLVAWESALPVHEAWNGVKTGLRPFRMPLFFLVSGVLAAPLLARPWEDAGRRRVVQLCWPYLVWAPVIALLLRVLLDLEPPSVTTLLAELASGHNELWYLFALPLFLGIAWTARKLPPWRIVGAAFALQLLIPDIQSAPHGQMLRCLPFFLLGALRPGLPLDLARRADVARMLICAAAFACAWFIRHLVGPPARPLVDLAAVALGVASAALAVARWPALAEPARWLGSRTLPIYILHFPLVAAAGPFLARILPPAVAGNVALAIAYPVLVTAGIVAASLAVHRVLLRSGLTILFEPPAAAIPSSRSRPMGDDVMRTSP